MRSVNYQPLISFVIRIIKNFKDLTVSIGFYLGEIIRDYFKSSFVYGLKIWNKPNESCLIAGNWSY